jgi:hypothetical protein
MLFMSEYKFAAMVTEFSFSVRVDSIHSFINLSLGVHEFLFRERNFLVCRSLKVSDVVRYNM